MKQRKQEPKALRLVCLNASGSMLSRANLFFRHRKVFPTDLNSTTVSIESACGILF